MDTGHSLNHLNFDFLTDVKIIHFFPSASSLLQCSSLQRGCIPIKHKYGFHVVLLQPEKLIENAFEALVNVLEYGVDFYNPQGSVNSEHLSRQILDSLLHSDREQNVP